MILGGLTLYYRGAFSFKTYKKLSPIKCFYFNKNLDYDPRLKNTDFF